MYRRLTAAHPAMIALNKLFNFMEKEKIQLSVGPYSQTYVTYNGQVFKLKDLEASYDSERHPIEVFPPTFEYKLLYEVPEEESAT